MPPVYILAGWIFTIAAAIGAGRVLLSFLRLPLTRAETWLFSFASGAALLSLTVFLIASAGAAYKGVFLAVAALWIAAGARRQVRSPESLPALPRAWLAGFVLLFLPFALLYFVNAMAPEYSPDGITYHLGLVSRYYREHRLVFVPSNMYSSLSQGLELLFLFAWSIGRHSAAALVHCTFLLALPWLMLSCGRRFGHPLAGIAGGLLVFLSPVAGIDGSSAYNDVCAAFTLFALVYLLLLWKDDRRTGYLILAGLLAGFAYAVKYTAGLAIPFALLFVLAYARRLRPVLVTGVAAIVLSGPWLVRNAIAAGNPLAPFANRWFPNPYFDAAYDQEYMRDMRNTADMPAREIPAELTVRGQILGGLLGPVFLLLPLSLAALRRPTGRIFAVAAVVFSLGYLFNTGTRFLLPALPCWSMAMGMAFEMSPPAMWVLLVFHAAASWPAGIAQYAVPQAWRLDRKLPLKAALRIVPEEEFLLTKTPAYLYARLLEVTVPRNGKVFAFGDIVGEAYTSRQVLVGYKSSQTRALMKGFWPALIPNLEPTRVLEWSFTPVTARRLRIQETSTAEWDNWSISELRLWHRGRELPRNGWKATTNAHPWSAPLAFDGSAVTRWSTHQAGRLDMYYELDLGSDQAFDTVQLEGAHDQYQVRLNLQLAGHSLGEPTEKRRPPFEGLRRAATAELKRAGIDYLLVDPANFGAEDIFGRPQDWGLSLLAQRNDVRLYRIE